MDRRSIGPAHQRAHRFARRRMHWALTLGTTLPKTDPGRLARRSTGASFALAVALLAGAGVLAMARPAPDWTSAELVIDTDSAAVFVNRDGILHPVPNLASALLLTKSATAVAPSRVSAADIATAPRGPMMGIADAPAQLPARDRLFGGDWSVCDTRGTTADHLVTTAVIGMRAPGAVLAAGDAVLVTSVPAAATTAYLLWAGRRIAVDLTDRPLVQALGLEGAAPRPVSAAMLAAVPATPPFVLTMPASTGRAGAVDVRDDADRRVPVGTVLRVRQADGRITLQLVHQDGVETVSPVVADLLVSRTGGKLATVDAWQLASTPPTREVAVDAGVLPPTAPRLMTTEPVLCATWRGAVAGWAVTSAGSLDPGLPVQPVTSPGRGVDQVQIPAGTGAVVRGAPDAVGGTAASTTYLVTDLGVTYPLADGVPGRLGLVDDGAAVPEAPGAVLGLLPRGPAMDTEDAERPWVHRGSRTPPEPSAPPGAVG